MKRTARVRSFIHAIGCYEDVRPRGGFLRRCGPCDRRQVCGCRLFGIECRDIRREREYPHFRLGMTERAHRTETT